MRTHLPTLDGFRALAISLLIVGHYALAWPPLPVLGQVELPLDAAVVALFVLSGFLSTRHFLREWQKTGDIAVTRFWSRKLVRFYPPLVVFVLVASAFQLSRGIDVPLTRVIAVLGFAGNYHYALAVGDTNQHIVSHLWPLAVGAQFFLVWPWVLRSALRTGRRTKLVVGTGTAIVAVMAIRTAMTWYSDVPAVYIYNATECRVDALLVGALLGLLLEEPRVTGWCDRMASNAGVVSLVLIALSLSCAGSLWYRRGPGYTLEALLLASLVGAAVSAERSGRWQWMRASALLHLSTVSFSLLLWHWYPLAVDGRLSAIPFVLRVPLVLVVTFAVGAVAYWPLERPLRARANRLAE